MKPQTYDDLAAERDALLTKVNLLTAQLAELATPPAYVPSYGDDRLCVCGHPYYRHFDTYDDMAAVGCKYFSSCGCEGFKQSPETEAK